MTDRMMKLMELDNEINKLLAENESEVEKEKLRYAEEFKTAYVAMAESLRPYHDLYVKTEGMQDYARNRFVINEEGWELSFRPYLGFVVTDPARKRSVGRCVKRWSSEREYDYLSPEEAANIYSTAKSFLDMLKHWDKWFTIFENSFIDKYHESKKIDIEIANKDLAWRKSLTI